MAVAEERWLATYIEAVIAEDDWFAGCVEELALLDQGVKLLQSVYRV